MTLEVPGSYSGQDSGDSAITSNLQAWGAAGWTLHSQSITVASTGIHHLLVALLVYERPLDEPRTHSVKTARTIGGARPAVSAPTRVA